MSASTGTAHDVGRQSAAVHATLRFAAGVTAAFVLCELLQWAPTFLAPVLTAVLLANLPMRPPLKLAVVLIVAMTGAALFTFAMASLLRTTPIVLFGAVSLCLFLSFHAMVSGRPALPVMLLLICLATIPVVVMVAPGQAGILPMALIRGIVIALVMTWLAYGCWPRISPPTPKPVAASRAPSSLALALLSTAVVVPLMLVYLLFGLADVLPVMVATVMLVINFDLRSSRQQALAMIMGNLVGGLLGLLMHTLLLTMPNIWFFGALLFLVLLGFGQRIAAGGPASAVALIACNAMLIIFGSAIASGDSSLSLWLARLLQFVLAGAFAAVMMSLVWHRAMTRRTAPPAVAAGKGDRLTQR